MQQPPNPEQPYSQQPYNPPQGAVPPPPQHPYYAPQPPPKKRGKGWLIALGVIIVVLFLCVAAASHGSSTPATTANTSNTTGNSDTTNTNITTNADTSTSHHKIGEVVSVDSTWAITVDSVSTSQGDTINVPKTSNTFLMITMTFKNISNQQQAMSSLLGLTLRGVDGTNYQQALYTGGQGMPDGNVAAGDVTKGVVSFEVPANIKQFTLDYSDLGGQVQTWDISD